MKKAVILFILLFFQPGYPCALRADSAVKIGVYNNPPLIFMGTDGTPKGIFADIIEYVAEKEHWRIEYVAGTFDQCMSRLADHQIDLLCTVAYTAERAQRYDFTRENLLTNWGQLFTARGSDIRSVADLSGKKVAVLKGDVHALALDRLIKDFGIACQIIETDDYHAVLQQVSAGKADAGVANRFFGMQFASRYNVDINGVVFNPIKIHYAAAKDQKAGLLRTVDRYIVALKKDERSIYYRSLEKWLGVALLKDGLSQWARWVIWIAIGVLVVLFAGVLIFKQQLRARTRELTAELALRRKTEADLRESEERWQFALEGSGDGVWDWDVNTGRVYFSRQWKAMLGFEEDEIGDTFDEWESRVHPDDKAHAHADLERHFAGKVPYYQNEHRMRCKDGTLKWILDRGKVMEWSQDGKPLRVIGIHTDITERRDAEKALRDSEQHLNAIFQANPDPMVIYDTNGYPRFINPAFTKVFGWSLDEVEGARIPFVPEDQKQITSEQIEAIYRTEKPTVFETRRLTRDGRSLSVIISAALIKEADTALSVGMIVNLTDITERKLLEAQYEHAQKMESLGTLAGGIAHDFNNLLMGIQGRASLMRMDLPLGHPCCEHIDGIEEYVRSATSLTRQLLGLARGGKYEVKPLDMNTLVKHSSEMFGRTRKEIRIQSRLSDGLPAVEADQGQIEHVLLNIYVNAWQAMPGGGTLSLETSQVILGDRFARLHQAEPGLYVKILISDTGIGIDDAVRHRIFDPFFTTKEKDRGTGLGLASAYGIIRNHGGFITVDSEIGHGATFAVFLPASGKEARSIAMEEGEPLKGKETVLLVDDEEMIIEVGRAMLQRLGYVVITARSGKAALDAVRTDGSKIDLVILDLIMPEMDGRATFDRIKAIAPDMAVLLSSGYALDSQAEAVLKSGCNGFLQKPFNIAELSKKIRTILDGR